VSVSHQGIDGATLQKIVALAGWLVRKFFVLESSGKVEGSKPFD
jgi:hypothetical protein